LSTGEAFADSLPVREREKLPLQLGCTSVEGVWSLSTTTASDSSPASDVAVSVVLCGTAGSTAPHLLLDEESRTVGERSGSLAAQRKQATTERPAASTKSFKPSATDQFVVSN